MSNLEELSQDAIKHLGGRAPVQKIAEHVAEALTEDEYRDRTWGGFVNQVRKALRAVGSNGLPSAVSVGDEYVQTVLLDVEEYRVVITGYMKRADANLELARRFAEECLHVHGIDIAVPRAATA